MNAEKELISIPNEKELNRLVEYYPSYKWEHRKSLLEGYLKKQTIEELLKAKLDSKQIKKPISGRAKGGHVRWIKDKVKRTIVRIKFLRYCLDEGHTKISANQKLLQEYGSKKDTDDSGQSNIRKMTNSSEFNKKHT